jgi:Zn-dependent M28 family amino/carboxypeptidase
MPGVTHNQTVRALDSPEIRNLVQRIDRELYATVLKHLAAYPTRHSASESFREAALWCKEQFRKMGYDQWTEQFSLPGSSIGSWNIVAGQNGSGTAPRKLILLTAHLDSVNLTDNGLGIAAPAPGADDNASGSAGVLELARILAGVKFRNDVRFVLFGGEEQGLFGSKHHIEQLTAEDRNRIQAVINMDMIGCINANPPSVLIEAADISKPLMEILQAAASAYTSLQVHTSLNPFDSDHVSFLDAGIPAVLTIEGADDQNLNEHSEKDTTERINYDLASDILRMNAVVLIQQLDII